MDFLAPGMARILHQALCRLGLPRIELYGLYPLMHSRLFYFFKYMFVQIISNTTNT